MTATEPTAGRCLACGDHLVSGPLGQQCLRCLLNLASLEEDDLGQVAVLFPELHIQGKIARGGFGTVFRAEHRRMRRPVALKFLDTALARSPEAVALFEAEMIHAGALDHPGIVRGYDAGEREGHWFIVMELIEGMDCGTLLKRHGTLPLAESCEIIRLAALALHHAHSRGLVHRDIKPGNLMVTEEAEGTSESWPVKVLDFGLAGLAVAPLFTEQGDHFLGTLEYVAPEQIETPGKVDARADIYALGATLRRMLTGRPLRESGSEHSLFQRMKAITTERPEPLGRLRPDLPTEFAAFCDRLVAVDPAARPASAEALAGALTSWCAGAELPRLFQGGPLSEKPFRPPPEPSPKRRPWRAVRRLAVLAGACALLFSLWRLHFHLTWLDRPAPMHATALPPAATPSPEGWRPVFSSTLSQERVLDSVSGPRLLDAGWAVEGEYANSDSLHCARPLPGGGFVFLKEPGATAKIWVRATDQKTTEMIAHSVRDQARGASYLGVAPDTGHFIWTIPHDRAGLHLQRARPDGTLLPPLRYNFAAEFPPGLFELGRAVLKAGGAGVADGYPWGVAFVTAGQAPAGSGLKAGDVLIADEGHREFFKGGESRPGVWRCRFDTDEPARRFGAVSRANYPCDVTVAHSGVYLLSRTNPLPVGPVTSADYQQRVFRWTPQGFLPCVLSEPVYDPTAIAADPLSEDVYVAQGGLIPSATLVLQQVLRLRPKAGQAGGFTVSVVAERFGKLAGAALLSLWMAGW